ncbi:hypothetical protein QBC38DRAFT_447848 [Podospora fimiseda]|uniref:ATPase AAA-type core domain-containing protein n=1 Tax=Podospora fimiseda TaxID=252190 RepID=A0AAN6YS07_9PEZI|nr:hypothetical protein QBC38DRAFT_447848 [Podospora fimiseda]
MSLEDYTSSLPAIFGANDHHDLTALGQRNNGFIDIIEHRTRRKDGGDDIRVIPTSRFQSKEARTTRESAEKKFSNHTLVLHRTVLESFQRSKVIRVGLEVYSPRLCRELRRLMTNKCYGSVDLDRHPIIFPLPFRDLFFHRDEIKTLSCQTQMCRCQTFDKAPQHFGSALGAHSIFRGSKEMQDVLTKRSNTLRQVLGNNMLSFKAQDYIGPAWMRIDYSDLRSTRQINLLHFEVLLRYLDERVVVVYRGYVPGPVQPLEDLNHRIAPREAEQPRKGGKTGRNVNPIFSTQEIESGSESSEDEFNPLEQRAALKKPEQEQERVDRPSDLQSLAELVHKVFHISEENFNWLFPAHVPAIGLRSKQGAYVLSANLRDTKWNQEAYEALQLDPITKDLVKSLVVGHNNSLLRGFDDIIGGKGQGLVFLLHGKPGLGKTLTAESLAEHLRRPLYSISGGELGTDVSTVEKKPNQVFFTTNRKQDSTMHSKPESMSPWHILL